MSNKDETYYESDLEKHKHWGSGPVDRSMATTIAKTIGYCCTYGIALTIGAVVAHYFLLR